MNPTGKVMLNYGAMSGLCSFVFFLMLQGMGWNALGQASLLGSWIPVVFICLATGKLRDHFLGGFITYGQAFRLGFLTACSGAFLFALILYIYGTAVNHELIEVYKSDVLEDLEKTKSILNDTIYEASMESLDKTTMFTIASSAFFSKTFGGLLVSLITAGFYRRTPMIQDQE